MGVKDKGEMQQDKGVEQENQENGMFQTRIINLLEKFDRVEEEEEARRRRLENVKRESWK